MVGDSNVDKEEEWRRLPLMAFMKVQTTAASKACSKEAEMCR